MRPRPDRILDYREFPILYVDDEVENLRIFELTFRRDFTILTASNGVDALEVLNRTPVAMVLSDQKMPGMVGTELLERVAELDEKTIRVLVTAYGDADTLGQAINNGSIYRYVPKPWSPEEMGLTIRRGIEVYALDRERDQLVTELTLLNRVSRSISRELESPLLLNLLVRTITDDFGYDAAALLMFNETELGNRWIFGESDGDDVSAAVSKIEFSDQSAPHLLGNLRLAKIQKLRYEDIADYEAPVRTWINEVAAEEVVIVPLVGASELIGAFWCDNRRGGARFGAEDVTLLEGLASQAVIAMENARLVDDLRRSREQVMRFDRLGTLGTLAAGIAHEINNPLVSIHTFLSMAPAKRHQDDEEFWGDYHSLAASEVERIRRLVETMRQLGRNQAEPTNRELVDLADLANQVAMLVGPRAKKRCVTLEISTGDEEAKIVAVRDHIHQVMMNLLLNGIDASEGGGKVVLAVVSDREGVGFEVSDTGDGIGEEDLDRVFDPFFTTKDPDEGTGLGLMICHRIVSDHGGTIEVRSRRGEGASFVVRFPNGN